VRSLARHLLAAGLALGATALRGEAAVVGGRPLPSPVRMQAAAGAGLPAQPGQPEPVLAGHRLFLRHCAQCHGEDAHGSRRGPDLGAARVRQATPAGLFDLLTNGRLRRGMPAWTRLPPEQRRQLVAYLETLAQPPAQ
jgi:mono/diheme cytochrome c family protein